MRVQLQRTGSAPHAQGCGRGRVRPAPTSRRERTRGRSLPAERSQSRAAARRPSHASRRAEPARRMNATAGEGADDGHKASRRRGPAALEASGLACERRQGRPGGGAAASYQGSGAGFGAHVIGHGGRDGTARDSVRERDDGAAVDARHGEDRVVSHCPMPWARCPPGAERARCLASVGRCGGKQGKLERALKPRERGASERRATWLRFGSSPARVRPSRPGWGGTAGIAAFGASAVGFCAPGAGQRVTPLLARPGAATR